MMSSQSTKAVRTEMPDWVNPMLATLTEEYFSDANWVYERKLDGVRCLVFKKNGVVRISSRNKNCLNKIYPELVDALRGMKADNFIADGEIVAFKGETSSFSLLQKRINVTLPDESLMKQIPVYIYLFDLIYRGEEDISDLPLRERKSVLKEYIDFADPVRFCLHRNENGESYLREACEKGWEGLIAKRADAPYQHSRSKDWLKFKCANQQELVIVGYTDPQGERVGFGALLLGFYENETLRYAGKVGTGFNEKELRELHKRMNRLQRKTSALGEDPGEEHVHWIRPELVAEIGFTEWTNDNKLRHPRYLGLRHDKKAAEVVKENP